MLANLAGDRSAPRIDLTYLPSGAPHFLGREAELAALDAAWESNGKTAIVELIAPGGTGKTALVKRWLDGMQRDNYRGAHRVFAWSFYSQGTSDERQASEDHFLGVALKWFGVEAESALDARDKGRRLAQAVAAHRTLLVLDGLEPLQYPPGPLAGRLRATGIESLLKHLSTAGQEGLCIISSRECMVDLAEYERSASDDSGTVLRLDLENLSPTDGARLLHALGANRAGSAPITPTDTELMVASSEAQGHALTLSLLGRYLAKAFDGDIRQRDRVDLAKMDARSGGQASRVVAAYESWLASGGEQGARELAALRLLGFFHQTASIENLAVLRAAPAIAGLTEPLQGLDEGEWNLTLAALADAGLLHRAGQQLDSHPLVREHLAASLRQRLTEAWREGHRRLYEQLCASAPRHPDDLSGLQPLYQAVVHGCLAGMHEEAFRKVYLDRILRIGSVDAHYYSIRRLGAVSADLGAVACFFVEPWRKVVSSLTDGAKNWLLKQAAFCLRALGRLEESLEPMRASVELGEKYEDWRSVAIGYGSLSELQLSLGRVADAVADAGQAVVYADRSGDAFLGIAGRTTLAEARHQQGQREAARADFVAAEQMLAQRQPGYPLLHSLQGFRYCDLLLAQAERGAWDGREDAGLAGVCGGVSKRAAQTLAWAEPHKVLLDIALDHLTLARCALYADLLQGQAPGATARQETETAVTGLRQAGQQDEIPRGLLTRAWLRHRLNDPAAAAADLIEAQQIAERGEMKLHLADIHLTRARLFQDKKELARARALIDECGYGRRLPELEVAEAATKKWPAHHQ
ncbi:MAG: hypothetical protein IPH35_02540 [Rhodoferax sp.]|nr:hypothetical protein [Rhodoferax sp.]